MSPNSNDTVKQLNLNSTNYDFCDEEAHTTLTGLQTSKQDNVTFNTTYSASTNKAATMQDIDDVIGDIPELTK